MEPRSAIIDAAARLLREQGAAALTTRGVAEAAGVQPPTLYRLFGDKDGLIDAVAEHVMATYVAAKSEPIDADPVTDLRAAWRMHNDFGLANPELYALLNRRGPHSPATDGRDRGAPRPCPAAGDGGRAQGQRAARVGADPRRRPGTVLALLATPPEQRDPGLADAMLEAVLAAILTDSPGSAPAGPAAVAIQFATLIDELPALSDAERALLGEWVARAIAALSSRLRVSRSRTRRISAIRSGMYVRAAVTSAPSSAAVSASSSSSCASDNGSSATPQ